MLQSIGRIVTSETQLWRRYHPHGRSFQPRRSRHRHQHLWRAPGGLAVIGSRFHAILDDLVGALLIVAPYLFGFATGGIEQWLPQILGAATIIMSLLTAYELSIAKLIPLPTQFVVDGASGALLVVSHCLFGFAGIIWWPHLLVGVMEIVVAVISKRHPHDARAH
ncbi:hypothetical protein [Pararhodobacter sp. SW119]|uniref:SPW repeat domain-containing protein n=1 Tax=Pararhodobacter sp. SW119 TaxID=2780075 RepID=UPI001FD73BA8|nr:hypothetical protein [Pararhodobacter sp. SW119]